MLVVSARKSGYTPLDCAACSRTGRDLIIITRKEFQRMLIPECDWEGRAGTGFPKQRPVRT
jgi:hypothetical protein